MSATLFGEWRLSFAFFIVQSVTYPFVHWFFLFFKFHSLFQYNQLLIWRWYKKNVMFEKLIKCFCYCLAIFEKWIQQLLILNLVYIHKNYKYIFFLHIQAVIITHWKFATHFKSYSKKHFIWSDAYVHYFLNELVLYSQKILKKYRTTPNQSRPPFPLQNIKSWHRKCIYDQTDQDESTLRMCCCP